MEKEADICEIIATLKEQVEKICLRRQELQEDEGVFKGVIERLNLHSCSVNYDRTAGWTEKENIMNAYQKAREDRDEYKFRLHRSENKIKELKEKLDAARLNQTQHNISIADVSLVNERKSSAYPSKLDLGDNGNKTCAGEELSTMNPVSEETYQRELNYLHKTNEQFLEQIRKLELERVSHEASLEKLNSYEGEITKLRKIVEQKQTKMMDMQIEFDKKFKYSKRDFTFQISALNSKILELEEVRDAQKIDLEAAHEEIRLLKLSIKKPMDKCFTQDEVKNLGGANRGTKRGQKGGKGPKKEPAASKKEAKKMKSSEEENTNTLENIINESMDASYSNTRKGTRANTKRKATDHSKDATVTNNKQNKKMTPKLETDENVEPCQLDYSSSSFNGTLGKIKLTEGTSTPVRKQLKKVQDDNNKRTYRRKNK